MDVEFLRGNKASRQVEVIPMNLTQEQLNELEKGEPVRVTIGQTQYILVREDVYQDEIDSSPWTAEEMDLLACEVADLIEDDLDEPL